MSLPAVVENRLPALYHETPASYLARQLDRVECLSPDLRTELKSVLAGMRITTSKAEVEALEARLRRLN